MYFEKGVSLPLFHKHLMMPWNDLRRGDCCGSFESISDGFYCKSCDFFIHKKCSESSKFIKLSCHSIHTLKLGNRPGKFCDSCGRDIVSLCYCCDVCNFHVDLNCAKYPPPERSHHELILLMERLEFQCSLCGKSGYGFPYKCYVRDLYFHVDCVWHPSEVNYQSDLNHSYHPLHPLKLLKGQPPDYSDGKCRLCGRNFDKMFYHCSSCNFSLDLRCVLHPPPQSLFDLKVHDHKLTLLPRLDSFKCNACGLHGGRSPYICVQCDFVIHQDCLTLPRLINVNRHDHRVSRVSLLGVVNSICGVCRQKVDWTCGGYFCKKCPGYVVQSKCATRKDVWNGKELEGMPEETEDIKPYVRIDDNTIQHCSHTEHYLRFHVNGILYEGNKRCNACAHPIGLQSFYGCRDCEFFLHQSCAKCTIRKWHVLHNERLTLITSEICDFWCYGCDRRSNGFRYKHGDNILDVLCGSISEPFVHPSHPHHPLYYILTGNDNNEICNGCKMEKFHVLRCIEDGCGFVLDFKCATLPQVVKHRVDDYPLSLCYGEKTNDKYWCDICEKETNPKKWFYTCKDYQATLHIECVLGDFVGLIPGRTIKRWKSSYEVVLNNSVSRPFCRSCKSHCIPHVILKMLGTLNAYFCSWDCAFSDYLLFRHNKLNTILLSGLSGSGKTVLFYQLRDGYSDLDTVPSMEPNEGTFVFHSEKTKKGIAKPVHLVDVPGHSWLRSMLNEYLPQAAAIVFVVDAVEFLPNLRAASKYLYDILTNASVVKNKIPLLICCNKTDKVTAHTKEFICRQLEKEIEKLRVSRSANDFTLGIEGEMFSFSHCYNKVTIAEASGLRGETDNVQEFIREYVN